METRTPSSVVHELRAQDFVGASDRSSDDTGFHEVELASAPAALQGYCRKDTDPIRYSHKIGQVRLSIQPGEVTGVVRQRHKVAPVELLCHRPLATGSPHEGYKRSSVQLQGRQSRQSHFPHSRWPSFGRALGMFPLLPPSPVLEPWKPSPLPRRIPLPIAGHAARGNRSVAVGCLAVVDAARSLTAQRPDGRRVRHVRMVDK